MRTIRTWALVGLFGLSSGAFAGAVRADDPPSKPGDTTPAATKSSGARACIEGMIAAAKKHDADALAAFFAEPDRSLLTKQWKATDGMKNATERLTKALDSKFGEGAAEEVGVRPARAGGMMLDGEVEIVDVTEQGVTATAKIKVTPPASAQGGPGAQGGQGGAPRTREETYELTQSDGKWLAKAPQRNFGGGRGGRGQGGGPGGQAGGQGGGRGQGGGTPPTAEQRAQQVDQMVTRMTKQADDTNALAADVESGKVASKDDAKTRYEALRPQRGGQRGGPGGQGGRGPGGGATPPAGGDAPKGDAPKGDAPKDSGKTDQPGGLR